MTLKDYVYVKTIGRGTYGTAMLVRRRPKCLINRAPVAPANRPLNLDRVPGRKNVGTNNKEADLEYLVLKSIETDKLQLEQERVDARNEVFVLSGLRHTNIIKYIDSFEERGRLYIVTEYAAGGDLHKYLRSRNGALLPEDQILRWFAQLCSAMSHIHHRNILHRDFKTKNIFLSQCREHLFVGDFGVSRVLEHTGDYARTAIGTPYYLSPEMCANQSYNFKSDIWALGCVLYELCTLRHAFEARGLQALLINIMKGTFAPINTCYSGPLSDLIASLLRKHPEERPDIDQILKIPLIKKRLEYHESNDRAGRLTPKLPSSYSGIEITGIPTRIEEGVEASTFRQGYYLPRHPCPGKGKAQISGPEKSPMAKDIRTCSPFDIIPLPPDINAQLAQLDKMFFDKQSPGPSKKKSSPTGLQRRIDHSPFGRPSTLVTSKKQPTQIHIGVPGTTPDHRDFIPDKSRRTREPMNHGKIDGRVVGNSKRSAVASQQTRCDSERPIASSRDKASAMESRSKHPYNPNENGGREFRRVTAPERHETRSPVVLGKCREAAPRVAASVKARLPSTDDEKRIRARDGRNSELIANRLSSERHRSYLHPYGNTSDVKARVCEISVVEKSRALVPCSTKVDVPSSEHMEISSQPVPLPKFQFQNRTLPLPGASSRDSIFTRIESLRMYLDESLGSKLFESSYKELIQAASNGDEAGGRRIMQRIRLETGEDGCAYAALLVQLVVTEEKAYHEDESRVIAL